MDTPFDFFSHWTAAHDSRLDWAYQAREVFLEDFDPEFQRLTSDQGGRAAFVALYGNTQVGKTTLILKLLGIRDDCFADVETILRAGRKRNKSSTSTAVIYLRSPDDHFHLVLSPQERLEQLDEEQLIEELDKLRKKLEYRSTLVPDKGDRDLPFNIFIKIPPRYFQDAAPEVNINIIDLPGLGGDPTEKQHLDYVMTRNLPLSTLILLVIKLNDKAVSLDGLEHPYVRNWRSMPQAFRIVTTHSLTNLMGENADRLQQIAGKADLVRHVRSEFHRTLQTEEGELPAIYPLEYGDSWEIMARNRAMNRFIPVIDELVQELRSDLQRFVTPHQKLMLTAALHAALLKEINTETAVRQKRLDEAEQKLSTLLEILDSLESECIRWEAELRQLRGAYADDNLTVDINYAPGGNSHLKVRADYESYAHEEVGRIDTQASWVLYGLPGRAGLPDSEDWTQNGAVKNVIRSCRSKLLNYCADMTWLNDFLNQGGRRSYFNQTLRSCCDEVEQEIRQLLREKVRAHNDDVDKKIKKRERNLQVNRERMEVLEMEASVARQQRDRLAADLEQYKNRSRQQLEHAGHFHRFLDDAFQARSEQIKARWKGDNVPSEILFLSAMEYALLLEDYHILNQAKTTH